MRHPSKFRLTFSSSERRFDELHASHHKGSRLLVSALDTSHNAYRYLTDHSVIRLQWRGIPDCEVSSGKTITYRLGHVWYHRRHDLSSLLIRSAS